MACLLLIVEDTFLIKSRGLVMLPGLVPQGQERFRTGDPIMLKRPDGLCLEWTIGGIEMIFVTPPRAQTAWWSCSRIWARMTSRSEQRCGQSIASTRDLQRLIYRRGLTVGPLTWVHFPCRVVLSARALSMAPNPLF